MLIRMLSTLTVLAAASLASADPTLSVDDITPLTSAFNPDYIGVDIKVDIPVAEKWTFAGIFGTTSLGATFVLPPETGLPGDPFIPVTAPDRDGDPLDDDERFSTFLSMPRAQHAVERFRLGAAIQVVGRYHGGSGAHVWDPTEIDVAYFDPPALPDQGTGYIARIVLDISATGLVASNVQVLVNNTGGGGTPIADIELEAHSALRTAPDLITLTFVEIPEPHTALLFALLLPGLAHCARRR